MTDGHVRFRWKNYARNNEQSTMTLSASEFIRRFLLHILPSGFVRIRHFGLLANRRRKDDLELCRQLLGVKVPQAETDLDHGTAEPEGSDTTEYVCPHCDEGAMLIVETLEREWSQSFHAWPTAAIERGPPILPKSEERADRRDQMQVPT